MDQRLGARTRYSSFDLKCLYDTQSSCSRLSPVFYTVVHNNGPHPLIAMARWLYMMPLGHPMPPLQYNSDDHDDYDYPYCAQPRPRDAPSHQHSGKLWAPQPGDV
ncbi:hypothetical protein FIBSPDRAFT_358591 [Athelia psychrophila]|uniref:Uncharacterized protein n=1 Tax=Athelia psychrophila TaxID=1759441 RepID=A0A166PKG8_9AGAM|nr:hypothetical protein FIBSPDRAFT_358591 [Fibularhizoctonia sp. CBS 109695]